MLNWHVIDENETDGTAEMYSSREEAEKAMEEMWAKRTQRDKDHTTTLYVGAWDSDNDPWEDDCDYTDPVEVGEVIR